MPVEREDLPSTIERSPGKVQRTYEKTLDSAHEQYDSESRARRTAWASVKNVAEKKGDHWELKGGGDAGGFSKQELYERAKELDIPGRSKMSRDELEEAVGEAPGKNGPSDPQAARGGEQARERPRRTYGGVDANKPKRELVKDAEEAGIDVKSSWTKHDLAEALQRHNDRETARARSG